MKQYLILFDEDHTKYEYTVQYNDVEAAHELKEEVIQAVWQE